MVIVKYLSAYTQCRFLAEDYLLGLRIECLLHEKAATKVIYTSIWERLHSEFNLQQMIDDQTALISQLFGSEAFNTTRQYELSSRQS